MSVHRQPELDKWRKNLFCTFDVGLGGKWCYTAGCQIGIRPWKQHPGTKQWRIIPCPRQCHEAHPGSKGDNPPAVFSRRKDPHCIGGIPQGDPCFWSMLLLCIILGSRILGDSLWDARRIPIHPPFFQRQEAAGLKGHLFRLYLLINQWWWL